MQQAWRLSFGKLHMVPARAPQIIAASKPGMQYVFCIWAHVPMLGASVRNPCYVATSASNWSNKQEFVQFSRCRR